MNVGLLGKRVFVDMIKLRICQDGIILDYPVTPVCIRNRRRQRSTQRRPREDGADTNDITTKPRNTWSHQKLEMAGKILP